MSAVYEVDENILSTIVNQIFYYGFEKGSESQIKDESVTLKGNIINPGDKIRGFDSGKHRTSFLLEDNSYMVFRGFYNECLLFEVDTEKPRKVDLFHERPKWHIAFGFVECTEILLMNSAPGCGYDINPIKVIRQ